MKSLEFYFFGDIGNFDFYNPSYVLNKKNVPEVLYIIADSKPFSICCKDIGEKAHINSSECTKILQSLKRIDAIEENDGFYRIKFPVFLEKDVHMMNNYINDIGQVIGDKIISLSSPLSECVSKLECSKYFTRERILYHIICDMIFDGRAFDYLAGKHIFTVSKKQPGNRDYIIIGYEKSRYVENQSSKLLCSSNNYRCSRFKFNSFGDSDGSRNDMFRYFKTVQQKVFDTGMNEKINVIYNKMLDSYNRQTACKCGRAIERIITAGINYNDLSEDEYKLYDFLIEMNYISKKEDGQLAVSVPVFYKSEINNQIEEISNMILQMIYPYIQDVFKKIKTDAAYLTAVKHGVDIKEIGNELYHQIFGSTNEYLVKRGFVAEPCFKNGEGRYLRSITID